MSSNLARRFGFVLEQTLGHVAHGRNLERALAAHPDLEAEVTRIPYSVPRGIGALPGLRNWSVRASWAARRGLEAQLARGPLDALFIHTQVASLLSAGVMARVPTIVSLDATPVNFDMEGAAYGHRRGSGAAEWIKRAINRRSLTAACKLVTWCQWAANSLVDDYGIDPSRIEVIHPGVDLELFQPRPKAGEGPTRVLFVGGDFERKGGPDLLDALTALGPGAPVELDIATGSEVVIPPGATVRVHRGLRPQSPELVELFRSADVFVLPTHGDCFPQVIGEAMACAVPVVATRVGAIPETIRDGVNGFLVPAGAADDLAFALRRLVEDRSLRAEMGRGALAVARERHDARRNAERIFALMDSISRR